MASAYYKGDEKSNPQLQRIYGTAFKNKTQLDEYFAMLEEAKKRDHRKLGRSSSFSPRRTTMSDPGCACGSRAAPPSSKS